jgi:hypothetical protein
MSTNAAKAQDAAALWRGDIGGRRVDDVADSLSPTPLIIGLENADAGLARWLVGQELGEFCIGLVVQHTPLRLASAPGPSRRR